MPEPGQELSASLSFDLSRASLFNHDVFRPFRVSSYQPLSDAITTRLLTPDTPVLVSEISPTPVALITTQMAYHHVAQGEIAGHPWLVSF